VAPSVDHSKIKVEGENKESTGAKTIPYGSGDDINGATANENNEVGTIVTIRPADLEALQKLSELYQDCMEEKQIGFMAKYLSIRKFAICSLIGIFGLQLVGIPFFITQGNMTLTDAVLFSAYTITSAGLGSIKIPHTTGFLLGVVIYLYIGITSLAIVVSIKLVLWTTIIFSKYLTSSIFLSSRLLKFTSIGLSEHNENDMHEIRPKQQSWAFKT